MKTIAVALLLAFAASAGAQEQPKPEPKKPALNLRLDDGTSAAPRITFEQRPAAQTKDEREKGLPDLGGKPSQSFDRPISSGSSSGAVIPKPYDPVVNQ